MAKRRPAKKKTRTAARKKVAKKPAKKKGARSAASRRMLARRKPAARKGAPRAATRAAAPNPVRQLARRLVDLTLKQDDEGCFALYAPTVVSVEPGMPPAVGLDAIRQKFAGWRQMVSEATWQAPHVWVDGNTIIVEWLGRVTFAGTGKQTDMHEIAVHEIENGKIARERFFYDRSALQP